MEFLKTKVFIPLSFTVIVLLFLSVRADDQMKQPFTPEQLSSFMAVLMEKCTAQKVGLQEASKAMIDSRKCFEEMTPVSLPKVNSGDKEWTKFKEAYAKDACPLWEKLTDCYKAPLQLLERCLEKEDLITGTLEKIHEILCINQGEEELSKLATQAIHSWPNCELPDEPFSETLRPCLGKYLDDPEDEHINFLCRDDDYFEIWKCTSEKVFQGCEDDTLGPNFYDFMANPELQLFVQDLVGCNSFEEIRDEL